jgi:CubicO group peptidase (beta-lactamase class C family)
MGGITNVVEFLESDLADLVEQRGVPGAAIAVLVGDAIVDRAAGVLSRSNGIAATPDSVFQIGSITKIWTTTLVMQLVDDGLLDLDSPIVNYLPGFSTSDATATGLITARMLLSHTAGFEGDLFLDTGNGPDAVQKFVTAIVPVTQLCPPGELFSYNNTAFSLLGAVIENLRGAPYEQVLIDRIVTPLALTHVAPSAYEAVLHGAAVGHITGADGTQASSPKWALARSNEPAGAMLAMRPRDLVTFARMHIDGGVAADGTRILSAASVAAMKTPHVDLPAIGMNADHWGLGWQLTDTSAGPMVSHDGGTIGQSAFLRVLPERNIAVALLTNGGDAGGLFVDVVARVLRELAGVELAPRPTPPSDSRTVDASAYVGSYSDTIYDIRISQAEDGRVWLDRVPKDILAEIGEQPLRSELAHLDGSSFIQVEGSLGVHPVYAFVGDDAAGHAKYIHYGRVIAYAGP